MFNRAAATTYLVNDAAQGDSTETEKTEQQRNATTKNRGADGNDRRLCTGTRSTENASESSKGDTGRDMLRCIILSMMRHAWCHTALPTTKHKAQRA
jgi:hypothetical protein